MKTFYVSVLTLCLFTGLLLNTWAQTPEGVVYQAEARDNKGNLLVNEPLDVKIMILKGHYDGETVWEEQHHVMTNNYGMFVLIIGTGTQSGGDRFEAVS